MGDGTLRKNNCNLSFKNKDSNLIEEVCKAVNKGIGDTKPKKIKTGDNCIDVTFNPVVGFIISLFGAPIGKKTSQSFDVPSWIKNGSKEIKSWFIRGLFDDEATISNDMKSQSRNIIFAQGKSLELQNSIEEFFSSIKLLLQVFGIKCSKTTVLNTFTDKNGNRKIILKFRISRKENFEKFEKFIGFTNPKKKLKLNECITSFVDREQSRKLILRVLGVSERNISTNKISEITGLRVKTTFSNLNRLWKEGKVEKSKGELFTANLWSLNKTQQRFLEGDML
jgi:intein/homing endonuclease